MRMPGRRVSVAIATPFDVRPYALAGMAFLALFLSLHALPPRIGAPVPEDHASAVTDAPGGAFGIDGLARMASPIVEGEKPGSPASRAQVVTYYGSPRTRDMGILGQHPPEELAMLLAERAARFDALNGETPVVPALHIVYAVAQPEPGSEGLYLQYLDDERTRDYLALARRFGFALILDVQIGHSTPLDEVRKLAPFLREPDVHVAIDPEFAVEGDVAPGQAIGSVDAAAINDVQRYLASFAEDHGLPRKMLIVHQFQGEMIAGADTIERRADVDLIIDMDGYGPAEIKEVKYGWYAAASYAPLGGIKIFLEHDPDPLTEEQILALEPRPALVVYQ